MKKFTLSAVALSVLLQGCASFHPETDRQIEDQATQIKDRYQSNLPQVKQNNILTKDTGAWVSDLKPMTEEEVTARASRALPAFLNINFTYTNPNQASLAEIISKLKQATNVNVKVDSTALDTNNVAPGVTTGSPMAPNGLPPLPNGANASSTGAGNAPAEASAATTSSVMLSNLVYSGSLAGYLDLLANRLGISWKYENGTIQFFKYETKVFKLKALPGTMDINSNIGSANKGASGSSGGSSNDSTTNTLGTNIDFKAKLDIWSAAQRTIQTMLSSFGKQNLFVSQELGTITITDTPLNLQQVQAFVDTINKDMNRQVSVKFAIYSVKSNQNDSVGLDFSLLGTGADATASAKSNSLFGDPLTNGTLGINILSGRFANSSFALNMLNKLGKTNLVTQGQIVTLNQQTAPLQLLDTVNYLASTSTTVSGTSNATQTELKPGSVTTGFSATVTPKIEDNNEIILQFSGSLSTLTSLDKFSSGDSTIQLPTTSSRNFLQKVKLHSGKTLMLTGYEQATVGTDDTGFGAHNSVLGKQTSKNGKDSIVILITPTVIE